MLRSYWLPYVAAVGIVVAAGSVLAQPIGDDPGGQSSADKTQAQPQTDQTPLALKAIKDAIERHARTVEAQRDEANAEAKDKREQSDLAAQWQMAHWTEYAVYVASGALVLTAFGVFLIWRTLVHTRRAADAAAAMVTEGQNATSAAVAAAKEAKRQADIAEKSTSPFLAIGIEEIKIAMSVVRNGDTITQAEYTNYPYINFFFKNYGRTPAVIKSIKAEFDDGPAPPDPSTIVVWFAPTPDHIVEAGKRTQVFSTQPMKLTPELKTRLQSGLTYLWLYGTVAFDDVFGNEFVSEFCWQYHGPQDIFAPYDRGQKRNRTYRDNGNNGPSS